MRISVVGGGSTYTPELIEGIARDGARLGIEAVTLHDVDADRLGIVGDFCQRLLARQGWPGRLTLTGDLDAAFDGAEMVIIQLRVGGQAARLRDETIPPRFGIVGQETTGPGGFAKALRTVPVVLDLAERYRRRHPDGWIIDFTNPVGIVSQALIDAGHRAIGLCNVAIGLQRSVAGALGIDARRVELESVGLNHASWFREIRVDGEPRLAALLADHAAAIEAETGRPIDELRAMGAIPSYYQHFYDDPAGALAEQVAEGTRAREVIDIERRLLAIYADPANDTKPDLLGERGGAWYSEAALEVIAALSGAEGPDGRRLVVNAANRGAIPGLADDQVVEVLATVSQAGAEALPVAPLAPWQQERIARLIDYQRLTIEAALSGDRSTAIEALAANPLVPSAEVAEPLLEALVETGLARLPRADSGA